MSVHSERGIARWLYPAAWLCVGAGYALAVLGALTIGPFLLLAAVTATIALVTRRAARRGAVGLVAGLGLPLLYVAYLNRGGPGTVCTAIAGGQQCTQEWSPWPWLAAGLVLLAAGAVAVTLVARAVPARG